MDFKSYWWIPGYILSLVVVLVVSLSIPSSVSVATACEAKSDEIISVDDFSSIPALVIEDAQNTAYSVYGDDKPEVKHLTSQLIGTYQASMGKDVVIIFNSGGWGWDPIEEIPGWGSILRGIETTLSNYGLNSLIIDYKRTSHSFAGVMNEIESMLGFYSYKVDELVARANFLTRQFPDLKIILTGESNGSVIGEKAMQRLSDNSRVYSIQCGTPFWYASQSSDRSLIINSNGIEPDSFSNGDWIEIIRANLEAAFGIYTGGKGNVLLYIGAPGHDYSWEYQEVRQRIIGFLECIFWEN
jgi:hypothetical protein